MSPFALKEFSNSLISIPLFLSNFQFWSETGYFATAGEEKPLLSNGVYRGTVLSFFPC